MQNKAYRPAILADINRVAAGIVAAAITGALAALIPYAVGYLAGPNRDLLPEPQWLWQVYPTALGAVVIGSPWSILLILVTRARLAPWRSLLVLPIGMAIGYLYLSTPLYRLPGLELASDWVGPLAYLAATVAGPLVGGLLASQLLRFFPMPSAADLEGSPT